ncbi:MAG: hypothetical protein JO136_20555 [Hyphomicrobiales bacterium]|nr:hypothetical protein [Hyphomicrobiales bacterium]
MSARAGVVTVTGANGVTPGGAAPPVTADEGHLIPNTDPSNTAEATGGNGGAGGNGATTTRCLFHCPPAPPATAGGAGGAATATATTSISSTTQATATATSAGGAGGAGGSNKIGGVGGPASATATASGAGTVLSQATAHAGAGGEDGPGTTAIDPYAYGGAAHAYATAVGLTGNVQSNASAYGGWALVPGTAAFAQSEAKNSKGEALTTASAPADAGGISPSAMTSAGVGPGNTIPITLNSSQVVSDAILNLTSPTNHETIGEGAMSAAFSGGLLQQTYAGTAVFDFATTSATSETLDLNMLSNDAVGIGFNSLTLQVINLVDNTTLLSETFSSLTEAAPFFENGNSVTLGTVTGESQSIEIEFSLSYWDSAGITSNASFGFAYALVDPPVSAVVPEQATWAMLIMGFVGLGVASWRRSRGSNSPPRLAR